MPWTRWWFDPPWNRGQPYGQPDDRRPPDVYRAWLRDTLTSAGRVSRSHVVWLPGDEHVRDLGRVVAGTGLAVHGLLPWWWHDQRHWQPVVWAGADATPAPPGLETLQRRLVRNRWQPPPEGTHPCPKPLQLFGALIETFAPAGGAVVDPFVGTGTTLVAAAASERRAMGVELDPGTAALAAARLRGVLGHRPAVDMVASSARSS